MRAEDSFAGQSLGAARRHLATLLTDAGRVSSRDVALFEARQLLQAATGLDHAGLIRGEGDPLASAAAARFDALAQRRLGGEPLSRILGQREFAGLTLQVAPDVLDPREDSEALVRLAMRVAPQPRRVLDLGTGSGALLCALLHASPAAIGVGVDLSPAACALARRNAHALGLAERAFIVRGHWAQALGGPFDLVVSNPPYIRSAALAGLAPEVRDHDPRAALDGGEDGLGAYRAILSDLPRIGAPQVLLVIEIGAGDAPMVEALITAHGRQVVDAESDGGGHVRALAARALPVK